MRPVKLKRFDELASEEVAKREIRTLLTKLSIDPPDAVVIVTIRHGIVNVHGTGAVDDLTALHAVAHGALDTAMEQMVQTVNRSGLDMDRPLDS